MSLTTATCGFCRNNLTSGSTAERTFPLHLKGASDFNFSIAGKKRKKNTRHVNVWDNKWFEHVAERFGWNEHKVLGIISHCTPDKHGGNAIHLNHM